MTSPRTASATYRDRAKKYALQVNKGKIPACKYVLQACNRYLSDLKRKDLVLSDEAERWCKFLERLPHVKGKWAAKHEPFLLSDYQVFIVVNVYGWKWKKTGRRRFREAYIEVPRKNGKSFFVSLLGLGHLTIDGEYGAEVYCGATSERQAWEVFRPAKQVCERTPDLTSHFGIEVNAKTLSIIKNGSRFEPVIGKPGDGSSPSCGIADEFHEHDTSDLIDTFATGMGARDNPMLLMITTAGSDMGGPCYAKRDDLIKILNGTVQDDRIFGIIYTIDEGDQWDTVEAQKKANPNFGVSVDADFLNGQLDQARRSAIKQTAYKTKHLNMWVGAKAAWMNMLAFQSCKKKINIQDFKGRECFIGLDLASKVDIAALGILIPPDGSNGRWAAFVKHYLPEDKITEGGNTRYKAWHSEGWLIATPGNVTDFGYIEDDLDELKSILMVQEVAYDPFQAIHLATRIEERGFKTVEYGATVKNFSQPMKEMEGLIMKKQIDFQKDPVLTWEFGNVVAKLDKKDNIFPDKERPENKIDGVVSLLMAFGRALRHRGGSVYDERDLIVLGD